MFDDQDGELFQGSRADMATTHANQMHDAIKVLRGWKSFLQNVPEDTEAEEVKIERTIKAVEMALMMMEDLYPQLAVHAALMQIREEEQIDTRLDPSDDQTFF